jgi:RNA polymerase sigma-70 factor (ECF subfamily)
LNPNEAEEVVQDTLITVSKSIRGFKYDSQKGSFKSWLRTTTIWRIRDHVRARHRQQTVAAAVSAESPGPGRTAGEETIGSNWDSDWEENLADAALERVKRRVDPKHFQMFDLATVKQWPTEKIAKTFQVSGGYVYLIKHRIRNQLRAEMKKLKADASRPAP